MSRRITIDARVAVFCEQFLQSAKIFAHRYPTLTKRVPLGSKIVSITVPDSSWGFLGDPLAGLRDCEGDSIPCDFEIILFDNAEYARLPIGTWPSDWHYPFGQLPQAKSQRFRVALDRHTGTVSVFDHKSRVCGVWVYEVARLPYWWIATPFRLQFSWIADSFDGELVHAAAVRHGNRGVLLTGLSGSGKSTLAHRLAEDGVEVISDDFVLIEKRVASSPYLRTKLHDPSLGLVPDLLPRVLNPQPRDQKRILEGVISENTVPVLVEDIALINIADLSSVQSETKSQIFKEMAVGTIPGVLGGSVRSLGRIASLVRHSATWRFTTSATLSDDVLAWKEFMGEKT